MLKKFARSSFFSLEGQDLDCGRHAPNSVAIAVAGANILAGLPKGLSGGGKLIDIISGFETSTVHIKRLRRLLRVEAGRLRKLRGLKPCDTQRREALLKALASLENGTDSTAEFLLCELSKLVEFIQTKAGHARYRRRRETTKRGRTRATQKEPKVKKRRLKTS